MANQIPKEATSLVRDTKNGRLSLEVLPVPEVDGPDDHLIKVKAVSITNGELEWPEPLELEKHVPGFEVTGIVVKAPSDSSYPEGTEVYARTAFGRHGSARAYSVVTTQEISRKPSNISWAEAATVPLSALTAWQALFVHGGLVAPTKKDDNERVRQQNAGKRVLVTAASGGVGIWTVQLASLAGAHVVGTCGSGNVEFVTSLGANEVLDYNKTSLDDWIRESSDRKFHLALDSVGGDTLNQAWRSVRSDGKFITIVAPLDKKRPDGVDEDVSGLFFIVEPNSEQLEEISALIEEAKCFPQVDSVFKLQDFEEAFKRVRGGHLSGKVVLTID